MAPRRVGQTIPDDDLLRALRDACVAAGRVLSQTEFERLRTRRGPAPGPAPSSGWPGYRAYRRRWGRWATVLAALGTWVAAHDPAFPLIGDLPGAAGPDPPPGQLRGGPPPRGGAPLSELDRGEPINIPGMLHAPVDSAGVILLFGVLARELGFAIAHASAPAGGRIGSARCEALTCEARRRHGDVWQRVRLAFAFASRDLAGSRPEPRDLLVCWRHDWPDCPLEVLELRREAAKHA